MPITEYNDYLDHWGFADSAEYRSPRGKVSRLVEAARWSRWRMQPVLRNDLEFQRQFVGMNYSFDGASKRVPINGIELFCNTHKRILVPATPRVSITTPHAQLKASAFEYELGTNAYLDEIRFKRRVEEVVLESFFTMGVAKIGNTIDANGDPRPFFGRVALQDLCLDMTARSFDELAYIGSRTRVPYEWAKENTDFDKKARERMTPVYKNQYDEWGTPRTETISQGEFGEWDEYEPMTELWEYYLPRTNEIWVLAADERGATWDNEEALMMEKWRGPSHGPYHFLWYIKPNNQLIPISPIMNLIDLHWVMNRGIRKLSRQQDGQKTVLGVERRAIADGRRIVEAADGEAIAIDNPGGMQEYQFRGIDRDSMTFNIWIQELFSEYGGNLSLLSGLGPQAETATQEQMLYQASSERSKAMGEQVRLFIKDCATDIAWYLFVNTDQRIPITKRSPSGRTWRSEFGPHSRQGSWLDYNFDLAPYSWVDQSPAQKLTTINYMWENVIMPLAQAGVMERFGMAPNVRGYFQTVARLTQMNELNDLIMNFQSMEAERGPTNEAPHQQQSGMKNNTKRTYERINRPGATRQGKNQILMQHLLGGKLQDAEKGALTRKVG